MIIRYEMKGLCDIIYKGRVARLIITDRTGKRGKKYGEYGNLVGIRHK